MIKSIHPFRPLRLQQGPRVALGVWSQPKRGRLNAAHSMEMLLRNTSRKLLTHKLLCVVAYRLNGNMTIS